MTGEIVQPAAKANQQAHQLVVLKILSHSGGGDLVPMLPRVPGCRKIEGWGRDYGKSGSVAVVVLLSSVVAAVRGEAPSENRRDNLLK